MSYKGALWIGGLEQYMDENFIMRSLHAVGETSAVSVKVVKNKATGGVSGYGFINYPNDEMALTAMHKLNGKVMPYTQPPTRFKLNHGSNRLLPGEKNHSIWVGDLSIEVDDLALYQFFSARFKTVVSAKVVLEESGASKGFGFVRFGNEIEQQTALTSMQGIEGLGDKAIKVSVAVHKPRETNAGQYTSPTDTPTTSWSSDYYNQYNQYWSQVAAWNQYQQQQQQQQQQSYYNYPGQSTTTSNLSVPPPPLPPSTPAPPLPPAARNPAKTSTTPSSSTTVSSTTSTNNQTKPKEKTPTSIFDGPLNASVEHTKKIDYKAVNRKYLSQSEELYYSAAESSWVDGCTFTELMSAT